jgi:cyanophycinase-like exopeptidase
VAGPRLLAIMGSGETTPTMAKVHREIFARLGPGRGPAVILGTPYGFQLNAADISARAVGYFRESVGQAVEVVPLARTEGVRTVELEEAFARLSEASWVFSGPGSPTYALRQWRGTVVPALLAEKLGSGGCIVFSSAAALTLGHFSVPVYEIYKAGSDPSWTEGLDLLGGFGMDVAVIPHYNNAEGGTHDTRFCYLGEVRLAAMEKLLPPGAFVLGVDEHTACLFDFSSGEVTVEGLGGVTVRAGGGSTFVPAGKILGVEELIGFARTSPGSPTSSYGVAPLAAAPPAPAPPAESPLVAEASRLNTAFDEALARRDGKAATEAALDMEQVVHAWSADTMQSDELDRARAGLRRMVLRLGELAGAGLRDPRDVVAPWVEAVLAEREEARRARRFADADRARERLAGLGVEVRDTPEGPLWELRGAQPMA